MKAGRSPQPSGTGRVEAFSDGVMAVAITLLVLDLRVPEPEPGRSLASGLLELWPNALAYVISFIAIGIMWLSHHTMFHRLAGVDHSVLVLNLVLLLCIVVLPFTTSVLSSYLDVPGQGVLAAVLYAGSFLVTSSLFFALQYHLLKRRPHLLREAPDPVQTRSILRRGLISIPDYVLAAAAALVSPYLTLGICMALGLFYLLSTAGLGDRRTSGS
ncbi:TMEM175 family protein [Glutamicibacter protophormiae]|uniref:TMEM175 family protein n=1 Tax=Glutamicibacter protophormiae TaxID=37930 RepID=UPI002A8255C3|nr:TMEM175 family protein [Glutamicibacter protophormiae]WPR66275.1 TMEM175 family protein [Glutamicibacter protophormiae]WPR69772.1 TMEM175 family protein [Glutamicibacter protophormiae]